ncbi:MAG: glycoside hydrolase family 10 protein, partial [Bacilli bacterium]
MKKIMTGLLLCLLLTVGISADNNVALTKFIKNQDGSYGYSDIPVPYYKGSTENIMIPASYVPPKEEFRAAWVATISNLNMGASTSEADFKAKYDTVLNNLKEYNMNAMIFQVRPLLDSYYPSKYAPYSQFIIKNSDAATNKQGYNPGFDPLAYMVDATHASGLEYHAWFNPYRVTNAKYQDLLKSAGYTKETLDAMSNEEIIGLLHEHKILAADNFAVLNPSAVMRFQERFILNPALPEVRQFVYNSISEIITNYDIDAVHFDDYFYPYRVGNVYFGPEEDRKEFELYGLTNGYSDDQDGLDAWRRSNVNELVKNLDEIITKHNIDNNKGVKFGISPFGIWEHKANNEAGSNTPITSSSSYSKQIYADAKHWIENSYIDYIIPQIYWSFDQEAAPYGELARWWNNAVEGSDVSLYIGHPNYKHVGNGGWEAAWMNSDEIINQLKFNQSLPNIKGSAMFSYNDLLPSDLSKVAASDVAKHTIKNESIVKIKEVYQKSSPKIPALPSLKHFDVQADVKSYLVNNELIWANKANSNISYYMI